MVILLTPAQEINPSPAEAWRCARSRVNRARRVHPRGPLQASFRCGSRPGLSSTGRRCSRRFFLQPTACGREEPPSVRRAKRSGRSVLGVRGEQGNKGQLEYLWVCGGLNLRHNLLKRASVDSQVFLVYPLPPPRWIYTLRANRVPSSKPTTKLTF
jgi:hypothetical protein